MKKRRDAPSSPLFKKLKVLQLADIIHLTTAIFVYKSINNLIDSPIQFRRQQNRVYNLRRVNELEIPFARSDQSKRFLHIRGSTIWNNLEPEIRSSRTIESFKRKLKKHLLTQYQ